MSVTSDLHMTNAEDIRWSLTELGEQAVARMRRTRCADCHRRPAGERDSTSMYCGSCDPDGARAFYARSAR